MAEERIRQFIKRQAARGAAPRGVARLEGPDDQEVPAWTRQMPPPRSGIANGPERRKTSSNAFPRFGLGPHRLQEREQTLFCLGRVHRQQVQVRPRAGSQQRAHGLQLPEGRRHDQCRAARARARVSGRAARQEQSDDVGGALARGDLCGRTPSSRRRVDGAEGFDLRAGGDVKGGPPIGGFLVWVSSST